MLNNPVHKIPLTLIDGDDLDIIRDALLPRQTITIDHSPFMADHSMTLYRQWRRLTCGISNEAGYVLSWVWDFLITYFIFHHYFIGSVLIGWT